MPRLRSRGRLIVWTLSAILVLATLLLAGVLWEVHRSVPTLDGQAQVPGLRAAVTISRDALGTAVVKGSNRLDVARGLGFVHAHPSFGGRRTGSAVRASGAGA
jgi:penicillin amidase